MFKPSVLLAVAKSPYKYLNCNVQELEVSDFHRPALSADRLYVEFTELHAYTSF